MNSNNLNKIITISVLIIVILAVILLLTGGGEKATLKLNGDSNIRIYQYNQFIDPGYEIIDTTDTRGFYINVEGIVNSNEVGTYTIKYLLYNKNGTLVSTANRIVTVLEDNLSNIKMYLKGDMEEYFFLNDYQDHGIEVYNGNNNVTDQVNIINNVKSDTIGEYEVQYQIKNSNNIKESIRKVHIIDYNIEKNIDYQNKFINLSIVCDDYSHTVLPNNTSVYSKSINYTFNNIGKYEFDIYLNSGSHKKYVVDIIKADNTGPTGTCSLSYSNNRTTITMNVTDKSGIKKYSYNGLDFYNKTTIINSLATNIMVRAYDIYDNYTDIKCKSEYGTGFRNINVGNNGNVLGKNGFIVCGSSVSSANQELDLLMQSYGYKTRGAVAAAGLYLTTYKYNIPYFWGGKYMQKGLNPEWGCRHKHDANHNCSRPIISDNSYCEWGLDCTGFTSWAFVQAGFDPNIIVNYGQERNSWGNFNPNKHKYEFNSSNQSIADRIKPGDLVYIPYKHVGLVIGVKNDSLQIAEMRGPILVNVISKTNGKSLSGQQGFTGFVLMDEFYKMYGNS